MDVMDIKVFPWQRTGYTLPPQIFEITDFNRTLEFLLPIFLKVNNTIDDFWLRSSLNIIQTLIPTKKSFFFYSIFGFTELQSGHWNEIEGFIQLSPG